ncbi:unnamed protein product [Dibothriocephalus latus]|uniref:Uncharacterized protein n=1 Tax=Dibothriocephalus latus TaxID=60516 RepID=A0A3P6Q315_DIBLA|nr:unnamed protein product [Dibothriocephalus latus]
MVTVKCYACVSLTQLIDALLDIEKTPRKPQYQIAAPEPLVFCEPEYEGLEWQTSPAARDEIVKHIQRMWTEQAVRCFPYAPTEYAGSWET